METVQSPYVTQFEDFLDKYYKAELEKLAEVFPEKKSLNVDYHHLEQFDAELADELISKAYIILHAIEQAVKQMNIAAPADFKPYIRIFNLPKENRFDVRDINSDKINRFLSIPGVITKITEVKPKIVTAVFECTHCSHVYTILQTDLTGKLHSPVMCSCERKNFRLLEDQSTFIDTQRAEIQEPLESSKLRGTEQAKTIPIWLEDDLTNKLVPGDKIEITGIFRLKTPKFQGSIYDKFIHANHVTKMQQEFEEIELKEEDEKQILDLSKDPKVYEKIVASVAPSIYGLTEIKEAIMLQLFGGTQNKVTPDGMKIRPDIHLLLIGDPGVGKSRLLQYVKMLAPKGIYVSGKSSTGAGLCVSGDSLISMQNPGLCEIGKFVEKNMINPKEEQEGAFASNKSFSVASCGNDFKTGFFGGTKIWKIKSPQTLVKIKTQRGKELTLTPNTPLFVLKGKDSEWIKSASIVPSQKIATSSTLPFSARKSTFVIDLIKNKNARVTNNISSFFSEVTGKLAEKYGSLENLASQYGLMRERVYRWRCSKFYQSMSLELLIKMATEAGFSLERIASEVHTIENYYGKKIKIPKKCDAELFYFAGLIAGDGNIYSNGKRAIIRFHSIDPKLRAKVILLVKSLFGLEAKEVFDKKRIPCVRLNSIIVAEILEKLGVPSGEKSDKIDIPEVLSSSAYFRDYLGGLFDTDGFVSLRKTKGSNSIGFTTTSKRLAAKLHLLLEQWGIVSRIRTRDKRKYNNIIKSRKIQYEITITGRENLRRFSDNVNFNREEKRDKLNFILSNTKKTVLPAKSDIYWDTIVEKQEIQGNSEWVYDLTVDDRHAFFANGILVHNTATAEKDDFAEGGWTLKAGALVLAAGGMAMIDEFDKMGEEDRSSMHEAMESGEIHVAKAGIVTTFRANAAILAGANPKFGRFDPYSLPAEQFNIPPTIMSRFDAIFPIKDIVDEVRDRELADHVLGTHAVAGYYAVQGKLPESMKASEEKILPEIEPDLIRKYIAYARRNVHPILTPESIEKIEEFYFELRKISEKQSSIAITPRQLEAIVRLAEASAKVRLSPVVEIEDSARAIKILKFYMKEIGVDPETGQFDVDIIATGTSKSKMDKVKTVYNTIKKLSKEYDEVQHDMILEEVKNQGVKPEDLEGILQQLKRSGDIYSPRYGVYKPAEEQKG